MKLSIVVPVYNTFDYLPKCLDSLIVPEQGDYEIIAVNDGSTDRSREVLTRYAERFPQLIRVIDTPNGGLGHARNTGLTDAKGDFVFFVDSDDWLPEHTVSEMLQLPYEEFDVAVFDFVHVDETGTETAHYSGCGRETAFTLEEYPEFLFAPHNAVNKLWRRSLFTQTGIRFPDRLWFEDLATTPKLYLSAGRILPLCRTWYCYFQRRGSIMLNASKAARNSEMIEVAETVMEYYRSVGALEQYRPQLEYKFFYEEYLASVTRVNQIDPASPVQAQLRDDYISRFPDYRRNPYVRAASPQLRLLETMIRKGHWHAVGALVALNNKRKGR
ncbi:MAG: glycosyltransferase family 2 protein [Oscillospiraceae bacterium]|nr:glycosyltransferase family 2 protein [Oscillospiraceae bacterium]